MDLLTEILRSLRLKGVVYFQANFRSPWGMEIPQGRCANFHIVTRGSCVAVSGEQSKSIDLNERDIVLFPRGAAHSLLSERNAKATPAEEILKSVDPSAPSDSVTIGEDGEITTTLICGHFEFDGSPNHPLLDRLDDCVHIQPNADGEAPWIALATELMRSLQNAKKTTGSAVAERLAEALLIQTLYSHVETLNERANFILAIQNEGVGRALELMHKNLNADLTLADLSRTAAMSRSAFAEKFRQMVGEPPMVYLARWRMLRARELLKSSELSMIEISEQVGYGSEATFSKAFKRLFGVNPGAYRRQAAGF